jgi:hypothetical protein
MTEQVSRRRAEVALEVGAVGDEAREPVVEVVEIDHVPPTDRGRWRTCGCG